MPIISDASMTRLASWVTTKVLKDSCDILRETRVAGSSGGFTITYPKHNTAPVPCAVLNIRHPQEQLIAGQEVGFMPKFILLPKEADILGSDRIQVGSITYHVIDLFAPETYEVVCKVLVRRGSLSG